MNKLIFLLLLTIGLFSSCSDTEEETCVFVDWIGEYSGTTNCNGATGDVTVSITELADSTLQVTIESGLTTILEPFLPDNCTHKTILNLGSRISEEYTLEGNQLTIIEEFETGLCTTTVIK